MRFSCEFITELPLAAAAALSLIKLLFLKNLSFLFFFFFFYSFFKNFIQNETLSLVIKISQHVQINI